jgi:outer membrane lipoprotein SlyB
LREVPSDGDDNNNRLPFIIPRYSLELSTQDGRRALAVASKVTTVASAAIYAYRIWRAVRTDYTTTRKRRPGKRTIKSSASAFIGWPGSALGGYIGAGIGTLFCGIGAVPFGISGGLFGSFAGSFTTEKVVDKYVSSDSEGEDEDKND